MYKNLITLSLTIIFSLLSVNTHSKEQRVYTLGVVPQFEIRHIRKIWNPILNEINKNTGIKIKLVGSPTISDFGKELRAGTFDFAYMNPYQFLFSNKSQGYIPLIRDIGRSLQGIIVVKRGSQIKSVEELKDKKVAFPSPNALGASLLIRATVKSKFNLDFSPVYVKTHSSVYLNVLVNQVSAGGGVQKTFNQQKDNIKAALKILYKTPKVPPHPFAAHPRIPKNIRKQVKNTLLKLGENPIGKSLLSKVPIKKIGPAKLPDYNSLKKFRLEKFYVR